MDTNKLRQLSDTCVTYAADAAKALAEAAATIDSLRAEQKTVSDKDYQLSCAKQFVDKHHSRLQCLAQRIGLQMESKMQAKLDDISDFIVELSKIASEAQCKQSMAKCTIDTLTADLAREVQRGDKLFYDNKTTADTFFKKNAECYRLQEELTHLKKSGASKEAADKIKFLEDAIADLKNTLGKYEQDSCKMQQDRNAAVNEMVAMRGRLVDDNLINRMNVAIDDILKHMDICVIYPHSSNKLQMLTDRVKALREVICGKPSPGRIMDQCILAITTIEKTCHDWRDRMA